MPNPGSPYFFAPSLVIPAKAGIHSDPCHCEAVLSRGNPGISDGPSQLASECNLRGIGNPVFHKKHKISYTKNIQKSILIYKKKNMMFTKKILPPNSKELLMEYEKKKIRYLQIRMDRPQAPQGCGAQHVFFKDSSR